jgi:hypothetical protein
MTVQLKYRLYRRNNGAFYWQENGTAKQGSLKTKDKREAETLLHAKNEAERQPTLFRRLRSVAPVPSAAKPTTRSGINHLLRRQPRTC